MSEAVVFLNRLSIPSNITSLKECYYHIVTILVGCNGLTNAAPTTTPEIRQITHPSIDGIYCSCLLCLKQKAVAVVSAEHSRFWQPRIHVHYQAVKELPPGKTAQLCHAAAEHSDATNGQL